MDNSYFFKNASNIEELKRKTKDKFGSRNSQQYNIIKAFKLDSKDYQMFCCNFKFNYEFLFQYIALMKIENNIWKSVLITCDGEEEILVLNNGYLYPAFTALPKNFDKISYL